MAAVRHLGFSYFRNFCEKFKFAPISMSISKIWWRSDDTRLSYSVIFDFQNGGRPTSSIWHDVTADHPRFVFGGLNILLKLHVDRDYILQNIAIFIHSPFGLKLPIDAPFGGIFGGYYPEMNFDIVVTPKGPSLGENTSYEP